MRDDVRRTCNRPFYRDIVISSCGGQKRQIHRPFRNGWQVHESARGLPIIGAFDNPRPAGINDLIPDRDRTNSLALSRNLEPNVTLTLV